ncbi:hypothetical protein DBV05_g7713 [Lasiodiplodia theobromae]|uniref:F-box domain-containing protein n=1 Tax=Lasiodiplodia theobromae TaxID=45133 RepID=A0A5N5D7L7_9PEZI|nr:hypothetical protein DBV05_g7713 [Lasiodiplodia theobromae]
MASFPALPEELVIGIFSYLAKEDLITSLRLFIITEHYDPGLEEDFTLPELYNFMDELVETWLLPCSTNLTSLVLYSDQYFGYMPKLDLRGVHFPRLQTLALGNYMFSHAWQLDWLASHAATLQHLYLDDCSIVHYALLYAYPDAEGYVANPLQPLPELQQRPVIRNYSLRWSHTFDRLRRSLHRLKTFRMGSSGLMGWRRRHRRGQEPLTADPSDPAVYTSLPLGLFPDRYLLCHMGMGPSWYTDLGTLSWPCEDEYGTREGDDELMAFVDQLEEGVLDREDKEALVRLVEGIGQGGAEDVKGMMERGWGWRNESVYGHI